MMKFELEKRALLNPKETNGAIALLDKKAKKLGSFKRFSIVFWDHPETEPKITPYDFRVRITGKIGLFTLKYGDWRGGGREENEFHFDIKELSSVVNLMRVLGYKWGTVTHVERRNYVIQSMEIVLDKYLDDGKAILEIEKRCESKREFKLAEKAIDKVFEGLQIKPLTKADMTEFVRYTNDKKENYFNLAKNPVEKYILLWKRKIKS